jgi:hypothetical protein
MNLIGKIRWSGLAGIRALNKEWSQERIFINIPDM